MDPCQIAQGADHSDTSDSDAVLAEIAPATASAQAAKSSVVHPVKQNERVNFSNINLRARDIQGRTMKFCFSKYGRKDLARSLARAGARRGVSKAVAKIEVLVRIYHANSIAKGRIPEKLFRGEAMRIWYYADLLCNVTDDVGPRTARRMESERLDREEKMSLDEYFQSVNDICLFAVHAAGDGERELPVQVRRADKDLVELTSNVAGVYRETTKSDLPKVSTTSLPGAWRTMRTLQCHPLWIVYDQLGIYLTAYDVNCLVEELQMKAPKPNR